MLGAFPRTQNVCSRKPSTLSAPSLELEFVKLKKLNIKSESRITTRPGIPTPTSAGLHRPVGLPRGCWRRTFRFLYKSKDEVESWEALTPASCRTTFSCQFRAGDRVPLHHRPPLRSWSAFAAGHRRFFSSLGFRFVSANLYWAFSLYQAPCEGLDTATS